MQNYSHRLSRRGPDHLLEELTAVLACGNPFEFNPLFLIVHSNLRARNAAHGGEEMLRLRLLASTWRIRLHDSARLTKPSSAPVPPVIWVLWHNRLLVIPVASRAAVPA